MIIKDVIHAKAFSLIIELLLNVVVSCPRNGILRQIQTCGGKTQATTEQP